MEQGLRTEFADWEEHEDCWTREVPCLYCGGSTVTLAGYMCACSRGRKQGLSLATVSKKVAAILRRRKEEAEILKRIGQP